jgi:hypothetical protein
MVRNKNAAPIFNEEEGTSLREEIRTSESK